jgi:hypothetical protein
MEANSLFNIDKERYESDLQIEREQKMLLKEEVDELHN